MRRFLKITGLSLLAILLILWLVFRFGMNMMRTDAEVAAYFAPDPPPQSHIYTVEGRPMRYVSLGADTLPTVLLIHGSPGSWDAWISYFQDSLLTRHCRLIAVDRAGYGGSFAEGYPTDLAGQAHGLMPILATIPDSVPLVVVGHSYGGSVAARLAMEAGARVQGLLLLAGIFDPELEERFWFQRPLQSPALSWLLPADMRASNEEMIPLRQGLLDMQDDWDRIKARTIIFQGGKDVLVKPGNADFAEAKLGDKVLKVVRQPDENHFMIWTQPTLVRDLIWELGQAASGG
ncbi:MAG: alpha/beta hydrolase [Bacteroidetes bacterium]|nr:MAG: alpha/beta hydrolase [Bacteroidota bacterium]